MTKGCSVHACRLTAENVKTIMNNRETIHFFFSRVIFTALSSFYLRLKSFKIMRDQLLTLIFNYYCILKHNFISESRFLIWKWNYYLLQEVKIACAKYPHGAKLQLVILVYTLFPSVILNSDNYSLLNICKCSIFSFL